MSTFWGSLYRCISCLLGVVLEGMAGQPYWSGESISARMWRKAQAGDAEAAKWVARIDSWHQPNHCENAYKRLKRLADLPPEYRPAGTPTE